MCVFSEVNLSFQARRYRHSGDKILDVNPRLMFFRILEEMSEAPRMAFKEC